MYIKILEKSICYIKKIMGQDEIFICIFKVKFYEV